MPVRLRWEFEKTRPDYKDKSKALHRNQILDLIDNNLLTSHFQPIFSLSGGSYIYGFEALARIQGQGSFHSITEVFNSARHCNVITNLDIACCSNAVREAALQGIANSSHILFVNMSPDTLCDPSYCVNMTNEIVNGWGLKRESVVFEITEESMIVNLDKLQKIIRLYKESGYKIAIDDFGVGFGGLKILSMIEPDFVKIDRHFISNIDKAIINYNLVHAMVIACHRMGIKVVAEGIERVEELDTVYSMGIDLCQGFYLGKPKPSIVCDLSVIKNFREQSKVTINGNGHERVETNFIGDIAVKADYITSDTPVKAVISRFMDDPNLGCQPVVDNGRIKGMIYRTRFMENQVVGKCGYGMHLNYHKNIKHVMETRFLAVEANESLEAVSQMVQKRKPENLYDEIAVTNNGKYYGIVPINILLEAITHKSIVLAKAANPLTGLPGNEAIQREIEKRIAQKMHFDVAYFDLNNFKPFNDYYGFQRGDHVIKSLAEILLKTTEETAKDNVFVGHIGGDDFILITHPVISIPTCERVIALFEQRQADFHGREDYIAGCYTAINRKGEMETFKLLSISIGIVSTEVYRINSFAELASIATEVKKAAKTLSSKQGKSAIVRDRRLQG